MQLEPEPEPEPEPEAGVEEESLDMLTSIAMANTKEVCDI